MSSTSTELLIGGFTLGGVALGGAINWIRDVQAQRKAQAEIDTAVMAASRLVWLEISHIYASLFVMASLPSEKRVPAAITAQLLESKQWDRYSEVLARQTELNFAKVEMAYTVGRIASERIASGASAAAYATNNKETLSNALHELQALTRTETFQFPLPQSAGGEDQPYGAHPGSPDV